MGRRGLPGVALDALELAPLALGFGALDVGTAFGWDPRLLNAIVAPPVLVRAALAVAAVIRGTAPGRRSGEDGGPNR